MSHGFRSALRICVFLVCFLIGFGRSRAGDRVEGHVFRSDDIGMTFSFPASFYSKTEQEMVRQRHDPSGREHVILALWDAPERAGIPRMAFLHDKKIRPAGSSRSEIAARYLGAMRQTVAEWQGVKISESKRVSLAGYAIWRLDYWHPADSAPPYNAAVVIPLKDRSILAIQVNAPSQSELDSEIDSLRELHFDESKRPD